MRAGLMVPTLFTFEPCPMERLREAAEIGDAQDFEALWVGDHLLWNVPMHEALSAAEDRTILRATVSGEPTK